MAKFEFGFEEVWFRLILKKLPANPDLFKPSSVEKAQTILRMGKLKVSAARVWAESAGLLYNEKSKFLLTPLGRLIAYHDPDMEEDGIWLALHYNLSRKISPAWFYAYYFNIFEPDDFGKSELESQMRLWWDQTHEKPMTDSVFNKLVFSPFKQIFEGTRFGNDFGFFQISENELFTRQTNGSVKIPPAILGYAILDWAMQNERTSVNLDTLFAPWGVGKILRMSKEDLDISFVDIGEIYQKQVAWISHTAGLNSISFSDLSPLTMISTYYHELNGEEPINALEKGRQEALKFSSNNTV